MLKWKQKSLFIQKLLFTVSLASFSIHVCPAHHILFQLMWCPFSACSIFAVTVSSQVRGGKQETLCAQIHGPTEPVSLTVALEMDSGSTVILEETVKQDFYRCLNFQVWLNIRTRGLAICDVSCFTSLFAFRYLLLHFFWKQGGIEHVFIG